MNPTPTPRDMKRQLTGQLALFAPPETPAEAPWVAGMRGHIRAGWQHDAACTAMPGDLFYPDDTTPAVRVDAARRVCLTCPVRNSCRATALVNTDEQGIWGGTTPDDRDALRADLDDGVPVGAALGRNYPDTRQQWKQQHREDAA